MKSEPSLPTRMHGVLLGTAVGDSIGLPMEGLPTARISRLGWTNPLRHRFLLGRGMMSDDTEHTLMVAQALLSSSNLDHFRNRFASKLKWWLLGLPAGVGIATARAALKLWLGVPPTRSGVYSAGNGGAMRSAIIGVSFPDPAQRRAYVKALVEVTHADKKAFHGALAIAEMVALSANGMPKKEMTLEHLRTIGDHDAAWQQLLLEMEAALEQERSLPEYWNTFGIEKGVSGYVYHTVPIALYAWQIYQGNFERAVTAVISLGGDTDTVAAITGALCGATHGSDSIPKKWVDGFQDWPRSKAYIRRLSDVLTDKLQGQPTKPTGCSTLALIPRNLLFLVVVLVHGLLRYLPGGLKFISPLGRPRPTTQST